MYEDEEYVINLDIYRANKSKRSSKDSKAYAPKYPKPKDENWVVILGANCQLESNHELVGLKRLNNLRSQQNTHVLFKTPLIEENPQFDLYDLSIYVMSDVYLGLDQQFDFKFKLNRK